MDPRPLLIVSLAVLLAALAVPVPAQAQGPVTAVIQGPEAMAPSTSAAFFVNATGGPGSETGGNFSVKYYLTGSDLGGAIPVLAGAQTVFDSTGHLRLNVTAPQKDQVITLVAEVNSTQGTRFERTTVTRAITVIAPIVLTATFANGGTSAALDVPVRFFVDGKFVGATNISRIDPGGTGTATLSYLPVGLAAGNHAVRVEADLNRNGVIEPDKGEVAVSDVFVKKGFELSWGWAIVIIGATVSVTGLVVRARRRRR